MTDKLFIYPTDTVWGVGGSIFSEHCYKKIAKLKGHETKKPLSIMFSDISSIHEYIDLPLQFNDTWLETFFKYESTLGVPKTWVKGNLPNWICEESEFITIRCIGNETIAKIISKVGTPITTTSLNLSGDSEITEEAKAKDFFNKYIPDEVFIENSETSCSGRSSTIVLISKDDKKIVRSGKYINEIKEHLKLLSA